MKPLLIFGNKQDLPNSLSDLELREELDLYSIIGRDWFLKMCCAVTGEGLTEVHLFDIICVTETGIGVAAMESVILQKQA